MKLLRLMLCFYTGLLMGCATPVEVKQALAVKDQHYAENIRLTEQYRQLVEQVNVRFQHWHRYVTTRHLLNLALAWAATDPKRSSVPDQEYAGLTAELMGVEVRGLVNDTRLQGLPARTGPDGQVLFAAGTGDTNGIIKKIPSLIAAVGRQVDLDYQRSTRIDLSPFDDYRTNVEVLRRLHSMVKGYLDIDMTVRRDDVKEIADAIKAPR
ncbi:MAG: hypothetical protein ACREJU_14550 [Nitrospiraceae bacterium]